MHGFGGCALLELMVRQDVYAELQRETVNEAAVSVWEELKQFRQLSRSLTSGLIVSAVSTVPWPVLFLYVTSAGSDGRSLLFVDTSVCIA